MPGLTPIQVPVPGTSGSVTADDTTVFGSAIDGDILITGSANYTIQTRSNPTNSYSIPSYGTVAWAPGATGKLIIGNCPLRCAVLDLSNAPQSAIVGPNYSYGGVSSSSATGATASGGGWYSTGSICWLDQWRGVGGGSGTTGNGANGGDYGGAMDGQGGGGGNGGAGGNGSGGTGGRATVGARPRCRGDHDRLLYPPFATWAGANRYLSGGGQHGGGGSGGAGDGTNAGGGGGAAGAPGSPIVIYAGEIITSASNIAPICNARGASGGNGANAATGNCGGGGGAAGAGGGWIYIYCGKRTGPEVIDALDCSGGNGGTGGLGVGTGTNGAGGQGGGAGTLALLIAGAPPKYLDTDSAAVAASGRNGGSGRVCRMSL